MLIVLVQSLIHGFKDTLLNTAEKQDRVNPQIVNLACFLAKNVIQILKTLKVGN